MLFCFSGTGNSRYIAERIGKALSENEIISLNSIIKSKQSLNKDSSSAMIFVTPTYAWRIPKIVEKTIRDNAPYSNNDAYFVMSCGGEIGNAGKYTKALCEDVGLNYKGTMGILMPENYIAMFSAPDNNKAIDIVNNTEKDIDKAIDFIKRDEAFIRQKVSLIDKIYSGIVNDAFYSLFVKDKKFYAKENCISCSKCEKLCPLNNIKLENGKPVWNGNCTHCMACICTCPVSAIEYGKKSINQPRYHCPK